MRHVIASRIQDESLKITFVAYGPNQINGPNIWLQRMLPVLAKKGFIPHVIFLMNSDTPCQVVKILQDQDIKCTLLQRQKYTEQNIIQLLKILKDDPPDVFVPNLSVPAYFAARWTEDAGIPSVGIIRSDDNFHHELIDSFADVNSDFCLSGIVSKSKYLGEIVDSRKPESLKTLVCPSGTLLPEQTALAPGNELRLVYTGRLIQRQKRIFDLIKSFHSVVTNIEGITARIYGEDRERGKVIKLIEKLKLGKKLKYGGLLPFDKIYDELLHHHVFVLLSDYEGMSTSLMEAMACGLVPICTRIKSGTTEIINHNENGLLVDNREEDFFNAVQRLKTEDGLWERLSKGARRTIENGYTTEICADRWAEFLHSLIQESGEKKEILEPELHEITLPPVKHTDNGMCREDKRMPAHIKKVSVPDKIRSKKSTDPFINPPLSAQFADLYIVRKAIKDSIAQSIPLFNGTLLDVGCGQMPYKEYILNANPNIKKYIGLDFAQGKYADLKQPNITWDGKTIPLEDATVNCAMATEVLEHCPEPLIVLKEIKRVLKPDGVFFFTVPFLWPLHDTPHDYYRYTPFSLERLLTEAGFEDIQIKAMGGWNASLAQMIGLWLKRAPMPDQTRQQMSDQLFPLYKQLVESGELEQDSEHPTMTSGWTGIGYKQLKIEPTVETNDCRDNDDLKICIVRNLSFAYSETFIEDHISFLSNNIQVLHGKNFPMYTPDGNCIFDERTEKQILNDRGCGISNIYDKNLSHYFKSKQFNVILSEYGINGAKIYKACELANIHHVVHFHGYDASSRDTLVKYKNAYQEMFKSASCLIVVSKAMRDKLISFGAPPEKVKLNPYGVSIARNDLADPDNSPPIFLAVGRFVEKKAPHITIQAFSKVCHKTPQSKLIMVGEGPLLSQCQDLVRNLGIQKHVFFAGVHSRRSVSKLMRLCRVFVQHSMTASNGDSEGLPLALLEAGAAGLPVISTRHAGIPDAVIEGENGFLVDEGDTEKMAEAMYNLARNPKMAGWMGRNYRQRIEKHFSIKKSMHGLQCILHKAIDMAN